MIDKYRESLYIESCRLKSLASDIMIVSYGDLEVFSISTGENWPENGRLYNWAAVGCCMPYSALVVLQ